MNNTTNSSSSSGDVARAVFFEYTFHYEPTVTPSVVMAVIFGAMTLLHFVLVLRFGGRFMSIAVVSGFLEMLGYCLRISVTNYPGAWAYLGFTIFTVVTPVLIALINYIVVGKLLLLTNKRVRILCSLSASSIKGIFLTTDVICAIVQTGGGIFLVVSLAMNNAFLTNIGETVVLAGLIIQLVFFGAFIYIVLRIFNDSTFLDSLHAKLGMTRTRTIFVGLAFTIVMLLIRNIYRVIEFASGSDGYVVTHEWVFFAFESAPIALAFTGYAIWHFGYLLNSAAEPEDVPFPPPYDVALLSLSSTSKPAQTAA